MAFASEQISSASQSLAAGASRQADFLQSTASSLEMMRSAARQNADSAVQANTLMNEAEEVVNSAKQFMNELSGSMEEISETSSQTRLIIKEIDEIAFQIKNRCILQHKTPFFGIPQKSCMEKPKLDQNNTFFCTEKFLNSDNCFVKFDFNAMCSPLKKAAHGVKLSNKAIAV